MNAKVSLYTTAIVFSGITLVLLILSVFLTGIALWLLLPVPIFVMVLGVMYLEAFGPPFTGNRSENWREEEVEKEMARLSRQTETPLPDLHESSAAEQLELKKLETLKRTDGDEDYV